MKRKNLIPSAIALILIIGVAFAAFRPNDQSEFCMAYYGEMENPPAAALEWCRAGGYFLWKSTLPINEDFTH